MGLTDELAPSDDNNIFGVDHSNGMQFVPSVDTLHDNELDDIKVFDASNLMLSTYEEGRFSYALTDHVDVVRY